MGFSNLKTFTEIKGNKHIDIEWRDGAIQIDIDCDSLVYLDETNAEEFIESLICACKCAGIELINIGYK